MKTKDVQVTFKFKDKTSTFWDKETRKMWVIHLFVLSAIVYAARVAMPVCATAISKEFGWNKADLGAVLGSFFWGYVTTQIVGGYFADKIGGDKVVFVAAVCWGTLILFTPTISKLHGIFGSSIILLTAARVGLGVTQGVHFPSIVSLLAHKVPEAERSYPMGVILAAANLGSLLCGGLGSVLLEHYSWERVFQVLGLITLSWTYIMWVSGKKQRSLVSLDTTSLPSPSPMQKTENVPWNLLFTKSAVWSLILGHICHSNSFHIMISWLPTFFHERFPYEKGWIYNVLPWTMSVPASIFSGWLSERLIKNNVSVTFTRKLAQCVAMGGSAIFFVILSRCKTFWYAVICSMLSITFQTVHHSGVVINPQDIAPAYAGSVFGVMNAFGALSSSFGVYATGCILNTSGSWTSVFNLMAALNIMGALIFVTWGTAKKVL